MSEHPTATVNSESPGAAGPVLHGDDGSTTRLGMPAESGVPENSGPSVDRKLVEETQQHIRILVNEIAELTKKDISPSQFYDGFTTRCVTALSSIGGAVWLKQNDQLSLEHQINFTKTQLHVEGDAASQHDRLLKRVFETGQPLTVPPTSLNHSDDSGNPTEYLLVLAPILQDNQPIGLIEIFQRPGAGPVTQRGYLRFLVQMSELAADYHRARRLRQLDERQSLWGNLDSFLAHVHQSLDVRQTGYNLSNEGRRLIDCDRLTVATTTTGKRLQVVASSGLDMVQRRADQVKLLETLSTTVCRAKKPLYYSGETKDLPPQIEDCLQDYLDLSHAKSIAVVPLVHDPEEREESKDRKTPRSKPKLLGALIVEQLSSQELSEEQINRIQLVAQHGASALSNANQYNSLFLLPVWQFLGRFRWFTRLANLPKTMSAVIILVLTALFLVAFPYEFSMPAKGIIQPVERRGIYAMVDGLVDVIDIPDRQNALVQQDQRLIVMKNIELDTQYASLESELWELLEMHESAKYRLSLLYGEKNKDNNIDQLKLKGEIKELELSYSSKKKQLENLQKKRELLTIYSPTTGMIDSLNLKQDLVGRPVTAGDRLMTVMVPDGPWEVELYLPERGAGHVLESHAESEEPLQVEFVLASNPEKSYSGLVKQIDRKAEVHDSDGNSLKVLVQFEAKDLNEALLRPGTRVTAKIHCGHQPIGYVLFREVWESAQSQVLFWF